MLEKRALRDLKEKMERRKERQEGKKYKQEEIDRLLPEFEKEKDELLFGKAKKGSYLCMHLNVTSSN